MTARAKARKDAEQMREFVRAFDEFMTAGAGMKGKPSPAAQDRFERARDRVVSTRTRLGAV